MCQFSYGGVAKTPGEMPGKSSLSPSLDEVTYTYTRPLSHIPWPGIGSHMPAFWYSTRELSARDRLSSQWKERECRLAALETGTSYEAMMGLRSLHLVNINVMTL